MLYTIVIFHFTDLPAKARRESLAAGQRVVCATVEAAIKITHTTSCRATFGIRHWALGTHTLICRLSVRVHKLSAGIGSTISIFSQAKPRCCPRGGEGRGITFDLLCCHNYSSYISHTVLPALPALLCLRSFPACSTLACLACLALGAFY